MYKKVLLETKTNEVIYMTSPNIQAAHAFTTRYGGVSRGIYMSLNLGVNSGDDLSGVRENYSLICSAIGISADDIVCSRQIHSARIRVVGRGDRGYLFKPTPYEADGLITSDAGVALTVFTADCVPILLHDPVRGAIGAVHSGWRGTALDVVGAAVRMMKSEFQCVPGDIAAAIGPCISKCCYETEQDVVDALGQVLPDAVEKCVEPRGYKFMVDLKEANRLLLLNAGVSDIIISDDCTSCHSDKYWSHRRTSGKRGSQAAIISIRQHMTEAMT